MSDPGEDTSAPPARYALLPGDPDRVSRLARRLGNARSLHVDGLLAAATGTLARAQVLVVATGMGGPSTALVAQRLAHDGVDTFLRVGGAGPVAEHVAAGDIVVATAAVRHEGTSARVLSRGWPAVATPAMVQVAVTAAGRGETAVRCGVVHTKDSFYGEVEPASSPVGPDLGAQWEAWQRLGVLASEMEAAALFALAHTHGWRAGALLKINDIAAQQGQAWADDEDLCALAVDSLAELIRLDGEDGGG